MIRTSFIVILAAIFAFLGIGCGKKTPTSPLEAMSGHWRTADRDNDEKSIRDYYFCKKYILVKGSGREDLWVLPIDDISETNDGKSVSITTGQIGWHSTSYSVEFSDNYSKANWVSSMTLLGQTLPINEPRVYKGDEGAESIIPNINSGEFDNLVSKMDAFKKAECEIKTLRDDAKFIRNNAKEEHFTINRQFDEDGESNGMYDAIVSDKLERCILLCPASVLGDSILKTGRLRVYKKPKNMPVTMTTTNRFTGASSERTEYFPCYKFEPRNPDDLESKAEKISGNLGDLRAAYETVKKEFERKFGPISIK